MLASIKKTFVVEWRGPYTEEKINLIHNKQDSGALYIVSGLQRYEHGSPVVQYIGITKRGAAIRFVDKGHKSQNVSRERQYWLAHLSNLTFEKNRDNLELVEHALIYVCDPEQNEKKRYSLPKHPVALVNRWFTEDGQYRERRVWPVQKYVPDVIVFDGESFWTCGRLKRESGL